MCELHQVPRLSAASFRELSSKERRKRARAYELVWSELEEEIATLQDLITHEALAELRELERYFDELRRAPGVTAARFVESLEAVGQAYADQLNIRISTIQNKRTKAFETKIEGTLQKAGEKFSTTATTRLGFKNPGFPQDARQWINTRVPEIADKMAVARKRAIFRSVVRGIRQGEAIDKIEGRIRQRYSQWARSSSATIARTEIGFVHAQSQWATISKLGIPPNELIKIWLTARDSRVRGLNPRDHGNHVVLDGQRRTFNQRFTNGLLYPRQPGGRPSEVINCRCVLLFERKGKMRKVKPGQFGTSPKSLPLNQFGDEEPAFSVVLPEELIEAIPSANRNDALDGAYDLYHRGKAAEGEISPLFKGIAEARKGEIHGYAFRLKTRKSIISKVGRLMNEEALSLPQALDDIRDINRYTMVFEHETFVDDAKAAIKAFEAKGWRYAGGNNAFGGDFYHGFNVKFEKGGQFVEVQFHTPTSIEIKEPSHVLYTKSRDLPKGSPERVEMEQQIKKLWADDTLPSGDWASLPTAETPKSNVVPFKSRPFTQQKKPYDVGKLPFYNRVKNVATGGGKE